MGIYLTSAELVLHQWRVRLREAQHTLTAARQKRGKTAKADIEGAEAGVKWAIRRTTAAQMTVDEERSRRLRLADSLIGVPQEA